MVLSLIKKEKKVRNTAAISKWAKYALAGASSIVLLATAFTSSALAEVRDSFEILTNNPLNQQVQTEDESIQADAQSNADTVTTWDAATKTLTMNKDATVGELHADIMNHVDEMEVFDFGEGHTLITGDGFQGNPVFTSGVDSFNSKLTTIKGNFTFGTLLDYYSDGTLISFFYGCTQLKEVTSLKDWVFPEEMFESSGSEGFFLAGTFAYCESIENWDFLKSWISQEKSLLLVPSTFLNCSTMKVFDALKDADTSECGGSQATFFNCTSLEVLDISNWESTNWTTNSMYAMFAVGDASTGQMDGSLPNLYQITMGNDFLPSVDSRFPYSDGWNAYYNGEIQATLSSEDELTAYQASAKAKGWGPTTYVKVGHEPYVPTPEPGPSPEPTPDPTPASDDAPLPATGDLPSTAATLLVTNAIALLGAAAIARALNTHTLKHRK